MVGEVQGKRAGISCQVIEMTASTVASLAGTPDLGKGRQEDASTKLHLTFMIFHLEPWVEELHQRLYMWISAKNFAKPLMFFLWLWWQSGTR